MRGRFLHSFCLRIRCGAVCVNFYLERSRNLQVLHAILQGEVKVLDGWGAVIF